ncbi:MAG TPA: FAD-dependent oxidoreductase [Rhizomicrobium sp.]|nr:FAD-dependent oxidoreductase [Rhizomicrobium sp.]
MAKLTAPTTTGTLSRRAFLGSASALTLAPALARASASNELDVAIVGGGVAGTYAAWRLALARPHLKTRLFEASDRIGGRLHSVSFPQAPHLVVEGGGMRFLDAHRHVSRLARTLELATREFPVDRDQDRVMLRGANYSESEVRAGAAHFPYRVPDRDQALDADYFGRAIAKIVPGVRGASDWRKIRAGYLFKGKQLRDWTNRALLLEGMSEEELALTEDASGYDDWIEGESGLDELDYYFAHDDESQPFQTLVGGYQGLPLTLAERAANAGAGVARTERLVSLGVTSSGFALAFRDRLDRVSELTSTSVILALPRRALECIADFPLARQPRFASLIASVTPIPACKSLLLYERPWWREHGIVEGRSITDMPARQFYCFGAEPERTASEAAGGYGVLMAYCDEKSVQTWTALAAPNAGFVSLDGDAALAREVHREAQLVIGTTDLKPLAAYFQNWTVDPYGGGWHYYALGHDGEADAEAILKPIPDQELYVCGEAYSHAQGWVEGALERTETVLQRHFGLVPPAWL